eukprot:COSAG01_NODE_2555_length_7461_cov_2.868514_2_plen_118_part_00
MGWGGLIRTEAVTEIPLRYRFISSSVLVNPTRHASLPAAAAGGVSSSTRGVRGLCVWRWGAAGQEGAVDVVMDAALRHPREPTVLQNACGCLGMLAFRSAAPPRCMRTRAPPTAPPN